MLLSIKPFEYDSAAIGLFGLVEARGAFAVLLVGKIDRRGGVTRLIRFRVFMMVTSFMVFCQVKASVLGVIFGIVLMDLGLQVVHVANQS